MLRAIKCSSSFLLTYNQFWCDQESTFELQQSPCHIKLGIGVS